MVTAPQKRTIKNTVAPAAKSRELPVGEISPGQLRDWNGENLYIRNNTHQFISFDDPVTKVAFSLGGKLTGEHITVIPVEAARNSGLQKMWRRGDVSISTDPDMEEELFLAEAEQVKQTEEDLGKKTNHVLTKSDSNVVYTGTEQNFEPKW